MTSISKKLVSEAEKIRLRKRDLRGLSWTYPVNMSTARKIAELPLGVVVIEGIISTAQVTLGA